MKVIKIKNIMKKNSEDERILELEEASKKIIKKDIEKVVEEKQGENKILQKAKTLDLNKFFKLFKQIQLAISFIKDYRAGLYKNIPWRTISLLVLALLYFWNPFDLIPDVLPIFGITDDAIMMATVFNAIKTDLTKYAEWKNYSLEGIF